MSKRGRDFWELFELFLGYVILDMCYVLVFWVVYLCCIWIISLLSVWTCVICGHVLCFWFWGWHEPPILYGHLFIMIWQLSLLSPCGIYIWLVVYCLWFYFCSNLLPLTLEAGAIYGWMEVTIYAYMFIFLYLWYAWMVGICVYWHIIYMPLLCI